MPDEAWRVDGYNLSNLAHDIQTYEGLDDVPDLIYDDVARMQDHGVDPATAYFGAGRKMVGMYVSTTLPNGAQPANQTQARANFDANLDTLLRVFYRRKLLDVQRTMSDGSVRRAYCRTVSGVKPSLIGVSSGLLVFDLQLPYSFWEDLNNTTQTVGIGANQVLTNFASATAPLTELEFDLNGPSSNPILRDPETGSFVRYNGSQASGNVITLKNADQTVTGAALSTIVHDGDPKWLSLYPIAGGPLITLESGTAGATVTVRGKKKYLR